VQAIRHPFTRTDKEDKNVTIRHAGLRLAVLSLAAVLPGCGGDSGNNPVVPTPTPVPTPTTSVIFQSAFPPLDPGGGAIGDFAIPNAGAVRAQMDWTFPANRMFIFIFSGTTCDDTVTFFLTGAAPGCTVLGQDIDPNTKPAVVNFTVAAAQNARVLVVNLGPTGESGVVQVTLTR
jgi:hypothetical protein